MCILHNTGNREVLYAIHNPMYNNIPGVGAYTYRHIPDILYYTYITCNVGTLHATRRVDVQRIVYSRQVRYTRITYTQGLHVFFLKQVHLSLVSTHYHTDASKSHKKRNICITEMN